MFYLITGKCITVIIQLNRITQLIQFEFMKGEFIMISFEEFIIEEGIPIYLQVVRHVKRGIVSGSIQNGDEVPSRRVLSALLGVNPNTIQKAYRMLEDEGLMESHSGAKSCMALDDTHIAAVCREMLDSDAKNVVTAMKQMGLSKEEALALIENYWED